MRRRADVSGGAVLMLALLYFFCGAKTLAALLAAAVVHELGHICALLLLGGRLSAFHFDISGMCIDYRGLNCTLPEIAALLAGPAAGLLLAYAASSWGNRTGSELLLLLSGYSFMLSALNLVPVLPLDGGRALFCLLTSLFGRSRACAAADSSGIAISIMLILFGLNLLGRRCGAAALICGIWLLIAQSGIVKSMRLL